MAQLQRAEGKIELTCEADKFFNAWSRKINVLSEICPEKIPSIELHEGTHWHKVGALITWHYVVNGRREFIKMKVTEIDENGKSMSYNCIDGHMKNYYKSFKSKIQAIPKGDGGCIVKWSSEYEKKNVDAPNADLYIEFLHGCAKHMAGSRLM